jgi:peptide/nickel transport system substrate-binding protein
MRRLVGAVLGLSLVLAACTKTGTTTGGTAGPQPGGGILRVANYAEPTSLNPLLATNTGENFVASLAFDLLVTIDDKGNQVPDLAATVPTLQNGGIAKNGLTVAYHLRHGVKWQDGAPFTSDDVKFSWQAVMNPANNVVERRGYDEVKSIDTPDPYTVVFHLKKPFAPFVDTVFGESDDPFRIVPKHILGQYPNINQVPFNQQPIGTGPFKVARWIHGDHIEYVANPSYFRGAPKLKGINVYIVPDGNTQEAQLRSHDIDLAIDVATSNLNNLKTHPTAGVAPLLVKGPSYNSITYNISHPPLDDVRVRQALSYAIDQKRIIDTLTYGTAVPAKADLSDFYWAYDPNVTTYPHDITKAKALLDAAGWTMGPNGVRLKNGRPFSLQLAYGQGNATARQLGVQVQSYLKDVGIDVQIKTYPYSLLYATKALGGILNSGKFDIAQYAWISGADPDDSSQWMCDTVPPNGNNISHYCNPKLDAAERDALSTFDRTRRKKDYSTTQKLLAGEAAAAFNYYQRRRYAVNTNLKNFTPNGVSEGWNAYEWNL